MHSVQEEGVRRSHLITSLKNYDENHKKNLISDSSLQRIDHHICASMPQCYV